MIGISVYLSDDSAEKQILRAAELGIRNAFTSFHIPEESGTLVDKARKLLSLFNDNGFDVYADVSHKTPEVLGVSSLKALKELGVKAIRLDDEFTPEEVVNLSKSFTLAINASTLSLREVREWLNIGLDPENLIAWHNFYPRPETGLDYASFIVQQKMFDELKIPVYAFIPGDREKRGPLFKGLPTLEDHRSTNPYLSAIELNSLGVKGIFIGDPDFSNELLGKLTRFDHEDLIELGYTGDAELEGDYQLRPDPGRDVLRLLDTRTKENVTPRNTFERHRGTITQDNDEYGRYRGEIQLVKRNLKADSAVNVIGKINESDLPLLDLMNPGQKIAFRK
ncbi:hypothetical protein JOC86_004332 [Bacillus pakistanensis]|uniref:DUF871 domain-containing protein n=1 Tax=Rossellomorea pakistanensis TaxID=992288 RepID=A0ABS2NIS2_9BACI|nr:MupG family TIM beta-alpha barrel fold protein [Bacillus pakistanensis]MBM7587758.1 hypothetical protein [Bacillus pakistanensis]